MPEETLNKIINIINSKNGSNIGTGLQLDLEESINSILPLEWEYEFYFNMGGVTEHIFKKNGVEQNLFN